MKATRPHVMVLDSDVDVLSPMYRLLSEGGCRVATYSSPWAARQYARDETPDAILTSIGFPGCEGLEIVRQFRRASPGSRIIVLAPENSRPPLREVARAGGDRVLGKSPEGEVLRTLDEALYTHSSQAPAELASPGISHPPL